MTDSSPALRLNCPFGKRGPSERIRTKSDSRAFRAALGQAMRLTLTRSHPIFARLIDPRHPDVRLLREVSLQAYPVVRHFLTCSEHLYFHCPLPKFKRAMLISGRLSRADNSVTLMQNFIRALGVSDAERDAVQALPATAALIDYRLRAVTDPARYHIGAAAVMIASEGQNLETSDGEARHELLANVDGLNQDDLEFFSVHQAEDVGLVEQGLNLVTALCATESMQQEALAAVDHTCSLFDSIYDDMYREFCAPLAMIEGMAS